MKAHVLATLLVRGNALAMFLVGAVRVFDLIYALLDPVYAPRLDAPGAVRFALAAIGFDWGLSFLLFVFSKRIGILFLIGTDESDI